MKKVFISFFINLFMAYFLFSYTFTIPASMIERDKFIFGGGINEYFKENDGSVFILPFQMHLGLAKRVEFIGMFPYIQLREQSKPEIDTFGDIILYLKFDLNQKYFKYPSFISSSYVENQFVFFMGFNIATGPSIQENREFQYFSVGVPDWRIGFLYGQYIDNFSIDFNFFYVMEQQLDENFLPFSDKIWDSKNNSYFFDIHKVIVKLLWPGRYPWTDDDAPEWEKYPHIDDYFVLNLGVNYYFEPEFLYFNYTIFSEINWLQSWSNWCPFVKQVLLTSGVEVEISESTSIIGSYSILLKKKLDHYFDNLYSLNVVFYL